MRSLAFAAAVVAAASIWFAWKEFADVTADLALERRARSAAEANLSQVIEALDVHRAHLQRVQHELREFQSIKNDLQAMEGRDAPLSPLLSATAERLFTR